jgi:hypothetical protein
MLKDILQVGLLLRRWIKQYMNEQKLPLGMKEKPTVEPPVNDGIRSPKNPFANILATEGYVIEIDGELKSKYKNSEAAMKAG